MHTACIIISSTTHHSPSTNDWHWFLFLLSSFTIQPVPSPSIYPPIHLQFNTPIRATPTFSTALFDNQNNILPWHLHSVSPKRKIQGYRSSLFPKSSTSS